MENRRDQQQVIEEIEQWIAGFVIDLNLCPFARRPFEAGRVRIVVSEAGDEEGLLHDLQRELQRLDDSRPEQIETSLLVVPELLQDFHDYNDFLDLADALLDAFDWVGHYQIASFHPDYQFAGTTAEAAENFTNRAPWPVLHLLREDLMAEAVARHPDPAGIPERNIETMNRMGRQALEALRVSLIRGSSRRH